MIVAGLSYGESQQINLPSSDFFLVVYHGVMEYLETKGDYSLLGLIFFLLLHPASEEVIR